MRATKTPKVFFSPVPIFMRPITSIIMESNTYIHTIQVGLYCRALLLQNHDARQRTKQQHYVSVDSIGQHKKKKHRS